MAGNVDERTGSLYESYPYDSQDGREDAAATGPRVFRGGSWLYAQRLVRAADRANVAPVVAYSTLGFRCARSGSEP
jgi:formylglycine-generating enzyme required for sulfatase activity